MDYFQLRIRHSERNEHGVAYLEAAYMFVLLLSFFSLVFSAGQYVYFNSQLDRVMDKVAFDSGFIPYTFQSSYNDSATKDINSQISLNESQLNTYLQDLANGIEQELVAAHGGESFSGNSLKIETSYVEVVVDVTDGQVKEHRQGVSFHSKNSSLGNDRESEVHNNVAEYVDEILHQSTEDGAFLYATPTAHFTTEGTDQRFSPRTMLVSVRVVWDIREEYWLKMGLDLFTKPVLERTKIIPLRGDITL